jgi:hypothetical protein
MLIETILGGVTGLIGNVVSGIFKYKNTKLEMERDVLQNSHELALIDAETKAMIEEAKANIKITQAQVEGAIEIEDSKAFMEAQKQGNKTLLDNQWVNALLSVENKWAKLITVPIASLISILFGFVDFLRGIIRPILTVYLCGVTTWVTWMAWEIMQAHGVALTAVQATVIFNDVTSIVTYLTVSCVTWWFGDRRMAKTIMETRGAKTSKMGDEIKI